MGCEGSFIPIKLIRLAYLVFGLGNRVMKLCIETGLRPHHFHMLILLSGLVGVPCSSTLSGHYTTSYGVAARLVGMASILPSFLRPRERDSTPCSHDCVAWELWKERNAKRCYSYATTGSYHQAFRRAVGLSRVRRSLVVYSE